MLRVLHVIIQLAVTVAGLMSLPVFGQAPDETRAAIKIEAKRTTPAVYGFSAATVNASSSKRTAMD